jgi:peptidoglycan/xylan/chitin deacetylase (PgdA/CDA1 family)
MWDYIYSYYHKNRLEFIFTLIAIFVIVSLIINLQLSKHNISGSKDESENSFEIEIKQNIFKNNSITNYTILHRECVYDDKSYLAIRSFKQDSNSYFLLIDIDKLKIVRLQYSNYQKCKSVKFDIDNSNYGRLRRLSMQNSKVLQRAGANRASNKNGIYLTIDMCPSGRRGFEERLFQKLSKLNIDNKKTAIAIAITNSWVKTHIKEFSKIINNKNLDISWINHSSNHHYDKYAKNSKNFMLKDKSIFESEILEVEKFLLKIGQLPSIFFRFPGLISDCELVTRVIYQYSLIPISSNNWLAKDNKSIKKGDIVLIHGNLNEKIGVRLLLDNLKNRTLKLKSIDSGFKIR